MKPEPLVESGWALIEADDSDVDELTAWFPDACSVHIWSGPEFRYPFTRESFRDDCRIDEMLSYCLKDPSGTMAAFGQLYERCGRAHFARLVTRPGMRGRGVGKRLIKMLIDAAKRSQKFEECSLFVFRNNEPAYRCYLAMDFVVQDYPQDAPMMDSCYFLTRNID